MKKLIKGLLYTIFTLIVFLFVAALNRGHIMDWLGKTHFGKLEIKNLGEHYRGVETNTGKIEGLYPLDSTGISTAPIQKAAEDFLKLLSATQKATLSFPIDDKEWRKWANVDNGIYKREGLSIKAMNAQQKEAAFNLMQVALSAKGYKLSRDIMKTDQTLHEIKDGLPQYNEELYFFTVMGTPSADEPWGWQLEGHHLAINYFILKDQVVMSPVFMGAEPVITKYGKYNGNTLFQDEQNVGLAFMKSLPVNKQTVATISKEKSGNNNLSEAGMDNLTIQYEGIKVSEFSDKEKTQLLNLINQYIGNIKEGHQQVKMEEVKKHLNGTYFAWVGSTADDAVFYYRIHSPVVLIEFDHQRPVADPEGFFSISPTRNHIHTMVRTPNGNDYGKDLLLQHLLEHHSH